MSDGEAQRTKTSGGLDQRTHGYALASVAASVAAYAALKSEGRDAVLEGPLGVGLMGTLITLGWAAMRSRDTHVFGVRTALAACTWIGLVVGLSAGGDAPPAAAMAGGAGLLAGLAAGTLAAASQSTGAVRARQRAGACTALWCGAGLIATLCAGSALGQAAALALGAVVFVWAAHLPFEAAGGGRPGNA